MIVGNNVESGLTDPEVFQNELEIERSFTQRREFRSVKQVWTQRMYSCCAGAYGSPHTRMAYNESIHSPTSSIGVAQ